MPSVHSFSRAFVAVEFSIVQSVRLAVTHLEGSDRNMRIGSSISILFRSSVLHDCHRRVVRRMTREQKRQSQRDRERGRESEGTRRIRGRRVSTYPRTN